MNMTTQGHKIAEFATDYGLSVCSDLEDRTIHLSATTRQDSWMEVQLFVKLNRFNARVRSQDFRDRWATK